jgi:hypothetical protein
MSRRLRDIVLVGVCLAILGAAGLFGWHYFSGKFDEFNDVAKPIVEDIADHDWSKEAMLRHASPGLRRWFEEPGHADSLASLRPFGRLKSFSGVTGFNQNSSDTATTASVTAGAEFDSGKADVVMLLSWGDDHWSLDKLTVTPAK